MGKPYKSGQRELLFRMIINFDAALHSVLPYTKAQIKQLKLVQTVILSLLYSAPLGEAKLRGQGWLGRLVAYHKKNFIEDLTRVALPITVTVEKAPENYEDHPGWDFEAVQRLVLLIEALGAEPARQAVRSAMAPSRRHYLPFGVDTYQLFPSWSEFSVVNENNDTMNLAGVDAKYGPRLFDDDTVVYIDNPLEARLPSPRITIKKMREVMEQEALLRRKMATTTTPLSTYSFTHAPPTQKAPKDATAAGSPEPSSNTTQESGSTNANEGSTAPPAGENAQENPQEDSPGKAEDSQGKAEAETPGNAEAETPGNAEAETPGNAETETPGNAEAETPGSAETGTPGNAETGTPGNAEAETPGNAEAETPGNSGD